MEERILCPIDFSEPSVAALKCALEMARRENLGVTVLYSYRLIQTEQDEEILDFKDKAEAAAREKFDSLEHIFECGAGPGPEFVIEIGFFSDCIARQVRTRAVNKIVIDSGMRSLLNDRYIRQEPFLHSLHVPVIVVGEHGQTA